MLVLLATVVQATKRSDESSSCKIYDVEMAVWAAAVVCFLMAYIHIEGVLDSWAACESVLNNATLLSASVSSIALRFVVDSSREARTTLSMCVSFVSAAQ